MAVVIFKAPCVGPGSTYYHQTLPGEETEIPDEHLSELDPKCLIVIKTTSEVTTEPPRAPGYLLREHDWLRKATTEEDKEVERLRQKEDANGKPVVRRRPNVIPGTTV